MGLSGVLRGSRRSDPRAARCAELVEWLGSKEYDPDKANFAELDKTVDGLAAKWAYKSRRKT